MAEVLLNPDTSNNTNSSTASSSSSGHPNSTRSNKKRLNWLNWMRKSLDRSNRSKLCSCGFFHHNNGGHESSTNHSDWPVFTMSQSGTYLKIQLLGFRTGRVSERSSSRRSAGITVLLHSSEIGCLRSTKCSSETLQNLLYFMYKKTHVVFSFFISCNFIFLPYEFPGLDQGIHKVKV